MSSEDIKQRFSDIVDFNQLTLPSEGMATALEDPEVRRLTRWLHGIDDDSTAPPTVRSYAGIITKLEAEHGIDAMEVAEVFRIALEEEREGSDRGRA